MGGFLPTALVLAMVVLLLWDWGGLAAQEPDSRTMELRIAAASSQDANTIALAKGTAERDIYRDGKLIAKWVLVLPEKVTSFVENRHLVTRRADGGKAELLVLVSTDDVTDKHVRRIGSGLDRFGGLALDVSLDEEGGRKLGNLSRRNLSRDDRVRHAAAILMLTDWSSKPEVARLNLRNWVELYKIFNCSGSFRVSACLISASHLSDWDLV